MDVPILDRERLDDSMVRLVEELAELLLVVVELLNNLVDLLTRGERATWIAFEQLDGFSLLGLVCPSQLSA